MNIIKVAENDIELVAGLFDQYRVFYKQKSDINNAQLYLNNRIKNNESVIFLAYEEAGGLRIPLGFAQLYPLFSSVSLKSLWQLNDLFVSDSARNKGVGQTLLNEVKKFAAETNARGVILETDSDNLIAQKLYEKNGYKKDPAIHYLLDL